MQNQELVRQRIDALRTGWPVTGLAAPKIVLPALGASALIVDVFGRPVTLVGLALVVLAAMPWLVQCWTERTGSTKTGPTSRVAVEPAAQRPAAQSTAPSRPAARVDHEPQRASRQPQGGQPQPLPRPDQSPPAQPARAAMPTRCQLVK